MVRTNSMVLELGFQLPNFELLNANSSKNEYFNSHNLDNRHLLLMFICAHCPFVKYIEKQIRVNLGFEGTPLILLWRGKQQRALNKEVERENIELIQKD